MSAEPDAQIRFMPCRWTPDKPDACPYCSGAACLRCEDELNSGPCEHGSYERHTWLVEREA